MVLNWPADQYNKIEGTDTLVCIWNFYDSGDMEDQREKRVCSINGVGVDGYPYEKNETGFLSHTIGKNQL